MAKKNANHPLSLQRIIILLQVEGLGSLWKVPTAAADGWSGCGNFLKLDDGSEVRRLDHSSLYTGDFSAARGAV